MSKWIQRGGCLAFALAYFVIAPGSYGLPATVWWFAMVFGVAVIWGAEFLDGYLGPSGSDSYVGIVKIVGWSALVGPAVWDLMVWALFATA